MAIILVVLCLVGAMAGSVLPTEIGATSRAKSTIPVASTLPRSPVARNTSCDAEPRYRDLSLPAAAQTAESTIELCHGP